MKGIPVLILYGNNSMQAEVIYSKRKTLEIAVHPDKRVIVRAPNGTSSDIIKGMMKKRSRWIQRQMDYFSKFEPRTTNRKYLSGETHLYLGRQYRLKVNIGEKDEVKLTRGFLHVCSRSGRDQKKIRLILDAWYKARAKIKFTESLKKCFPKFKAWDHEYPQINIRRMKSRWGSLSSRGVITLNVDLIRAPSECIDYVITHELCHQEHKKHGSDFYKLLEKMMPDWERRKHTLEITTA
ncbi:MAG TPA: SprT family zinc-dependent metalloprotease [Deltaproteobacteria bacterium]|nr:SprT family zinc-dependent metalloprotease [Deltaproteobacteria bacterium]HPA70181.1 SprT family zinc-dependent metalloprotease [Bacteroidales bacterium]HQO61466.1 SprT family zinc-dependent metalloprotease [Deltaproteobacteria bacterium]